MIDWWAIKAVMLGASVLLLAGCAPDVSAPESTHTELADMAWGDGTSSPPEALAFIREDVPAWLEPQAPFQIVDNLYYVGSKGLAVYLITGEYGHILIDGGLPETAPMVLGNITALGFQPSDVSLLLNTHAHADHAGGLAALKAATGAMLYASGGDRSALEGGFYLGSEDQTALRFPPVKVDEEIYDGTLIHRGDMFLVANMTPGHSRGCTSWTLNVSDGDKELDVLIFCSATVAANRLSGPPQYEGIVEDYRATFAKITQWRPDIFLANHPEFFGMAQKRAAQLAGDRAAFVDVEAFPSLSARLQSEFEAALEESE